MLPYTIQCTNCGEDRLGILKTQVEKVIPVREECAQCGGDGFDILADIRGD